MIRQIRSFVRRGRVTTAQAQAFDAFWPHYGLSIEKGKCDFDAIFKRQAPRILEIGFGSGASLGALAKVHPECDFIGIEMHKPGIGALFLTMQAEQLDNIRVFYADAVEVLTQCVSENSLDVIQIFFPDPWPKRKHHKRRLVQTSFIELLIPKLKSNGSLHIATDWEDYAKEMMQVLSVTNQLENVAGVGEFADRSTQRPITTKFERRGEKSGRAIWELQFSRSAG